MLSQTQIQYQKQASSPRNKILTMVCKGMASEIRGMKPEEKKYILEHIIKSHIYIKATICLI